MAPFVGVFAGNHDLVALAGPDLVVAAGAAVALLGLVRLHVPHVDTAIGFRPAVRAHGPVTVPPVDGLLVERADGIVTLTINRPERKNAITGEI